MKPELSIVIVNWNGIKFLPDCLYSILQYPPDCPFEIIVVDNNSSDGSQEWLRSDKLSCQSGKLRLIESPTNLGYGSANNLVFEQTTSPMVLVLNSDTRVTHGSIDRLMGTMRSDNRIGVVGPRLLNEDGTLQPSVCRYPQTPASIMIDGLQLNRVIPKFLLRRWLYGWNWEHDQRESVPIVAGSAMLCRRLMIDDVGGFDKSIHMYGEELEWCVRIRRSGWKIFFEPEANIYHGRGKSTSQRWDENERSLVQERALIDFEKKSFSPTLNFMNSFTKIFVLCTHWLRWKVQSKDTLILREMLKLQMNNCRNQFLNTIGYRRV